jgi:hypothetical protein
MTKKSQKIFNMKKMKKLSFVLLAFLLASCELFLFEEDRRSADPLVNFDYLWLEIDQKYSYFQLKGINWQEVRDRYRPRLTADADEKQLFDVLAAMMNELRDDHANLAAPFNVSRFNVPLRSPANFNLRTIEEFYVPNAWLTGAFMHDFLHNNEIGYLRYSSFRGMFTDEEMDFILTRYKNTRGLILDLRDNGGGIIFNVISLLARFTEAKTLIGSNIVRNGPGHNDFSKPRNFFITPFDGLRYTKPVMVLIDRGSYSATTFFALATKAMPNLTLIGDRTGGGGGLPNGGQLPNGWFYRFSVSQLLDLNGNNFAEEGVPPDIEAAFDWSNLARDEIIERAIAEIMSR